MREFRYERAADAAAAVALLAGDARRRLPRRRHQPGRPDEARRRHPRRARRRPPADLDRGRPTCPTAGCGSAPRVPNADLAADRRVRERYPVLAQALLAGASGQLRNRATTGGNLLQRTRCGYFTDVTTPCNKREPGSGLRRVEGLPQPRPRPILGAPEHLRRHPPVGHGGGDAPRSTPSSGCSARTASATRPDRRPAPAARRRPARATPSLRHGELITAIDLPPLPDGARSRYRKVRDRASLRLRAGQRGRGARRRRTASSRDVRLALGRRGAQAVAGDASPRRRCAAGRPPRRRSAPPPTPSWPRPRRCATTGSRCRWPATRRRDAARPRRRTPDDHRRPRPPAAVGRP